MAVFQAEVPLTVRLRDELPPPTHHGSDLWLIWASQNGRDGCGTPSRSPKLMAERQDLDFTYSLTDRVIRLSLGELADFSGAKYDGDFSLSLEQAQRRKHDYVAEQIGIEAGRRVLDLGCGWGDC
jgi:hypothetical protein